jgi:hypothetical protein
MTLRDFSKALYVAYFLLAAARASGQTGQVTGRITDTSDAPIPAATVATTNVNTGIERKMTTSSDGYYTVSVLPAGRYSVSVAKAGF